jgi:hypothetical protein
MSERSKGRMVTMTRVQVPTVINPEMSGGPLVVPPPDRSMICRGNLIRRVVRAEANSNQPEKPHRHLHRLGRRMGSHLVARELMGKSQIAEHSVFGSRFHLMVITDVLATPYSVPISTCDALIRLLLRQCGSHQTCAWVRRLIPTRKSKVVCAREVLPRMPKAKVRIPRKVMMERKLMNGATGGRLAQTKIMQSAPRNYQTAKWFADP